MTLSACIARMIAAGVAPEEAGALAAEIYAAGVASASVRSSGAERTRRWREKQASQSDVKRHQTSRGDGENKTSPSVTKRHEPSQCDAAVVLPIEDKIKNSKRQNSDRPSRGTRIDPDWTPTHAERDFAIREGLSGSEIDREAARFRDYWKGRAGSGGVKLDWQATWQNWIRSTAEKLGRAPRRADGQPVSNMFHAKFGSEELDAWDAYTKGKTGKHLPRDSKGGWTVPTQWPPGYQRQEHPVPISVPRLKSI